MILKKRFFTGTEILLGVAILFGAGSSVKNFSDRRAIKKLTKANVEQAVEIKNLVYSVDDLNKKKDVITDEKIELEKKLKKEASTGFSILFEQATDIASENLTTFTKEHVDTAQKYVEVWGYEAIASIIKWQQGAISKHLEETKRLMKRNAELEKEYSIYKEKTSQEIKNTKELSEKHEQTAKSLEAKAKEFISANDRLIFWVIVIGGGYLFITFGGAGALMRAKKNALSSADHFRRKNNAAIRAIKTFNKIDDIGNATMASIIDVSDDLDLEEDDANEDPVRSHKKYKKRKKG